MIRYGMEIKDFPAIKFRSIHLSGSTKYQMCEGGGDVEGV